MHCCKYDQVISIPHNLRSEYGMDLMLYDYSNVDIGHCPFLGADSVFDRSLTQCPYIILIN